MGYEYRLEEVDAAKSNAYEEQKKAQKKKQEEWKQKQKSAEKVVAPQK